MKGIVLEIRNGVAAVLREDGIVVKTRQKCKVGDTIIVAADRTNSSRDLRVIASAVAASLAIAAVGGGLYSYETVVACSYVSLDNNYSIEYVLNRRNQILDVISLNDESSDAVQVLLEQPVKGKSLTNALDLTREVLSEEAFLESDSDSYVLVNVASDSEKRRQLLSGEVEETLGSSEGNITLVITEADLDDRSKAAELGISTGRYDQIRTIEEKETGEAPEISRDTADTYRDVPVQDMMVHAGQISEPASQDGSGAGAGEPVPASGISGADPKGADNGTGAFSGGHDQPGISITDSVDSTNEPNIHTDTADGWIGKENKERLEESAGSIPPSEESRIDSGRDTGTASPEKSFDNPAAGTAAYTEPDNTQDHASSDQQQVSGSYVQNTQGMREGSYDAGQAGSFPEDQGSGSPAGFEPSQVSRDNADMNQNRSDGSGSAEPNSPGSSRPDNESTGMDQGNVFSSGGSVPDGGAMGGGNPGGNGPR